MDRARLEHLFGSVWQSALDHAGVLSRRRLREIAAGADATEALEAVVEFLERTQPEFWPERWSGLGKHSATCPTLSFPGARERLVAGRICREDAVLVWDYADADDQTSEGPVRNLAVGLYYRGMFDGLARDHVDRTRWQLWSRQWSNAHGVPLVSGSLRTAGATPEGNVAQWIVRDGLAGAPLERMLRLLKERVHEFSRSKVDDFAERYRRLVEENAA